MRILVVPDKFKGTLTARQAAQAIASGWRSIRRDDDIQLLPMTDGGDGFGEVMSQLTGAQVRKVRTVDAAGRNCLARWWLNPRDHSAIIESANIIGLAMLPPGQFHPFKLDTRGLGAVIHAAVQAGATRCLIGIGGSATNDGGFGLARSLGWDFRDRSGLPVETWTDLPRAVKVIPPKRHRWFRSSVIAVDVQNRLLGRRGATRVYGPQKGITSADFPTAERALATLAKLLAARSGTNHAAEPGTGAAGGLGFGLRAFLGGRLQSGFDLFAARVHLEQSIRRSDLVITGEGRIDASSLMGKGVGEVANLCRRFRVPCIGLCGSVGDDVRSRAPQSVPSTEKYFVWTVGTTDLADHADVLARPAFWLRKLAATAASLSPVA